MEKRALSPTMHTVMVLLLDSKYATNVIASFIHHNKNQKTLFALEQDIQLIFAALVTTKFTMAEELFLARTAAKMLIVHMQHREKYKTKTMQNSWEYITAKDALEISLEKIQTGSLCTTIPTSLIPSFM